MRGCRTALETGMPAMPWRVVPLLSQPFVNRPFSFGLRFPPPMDPQPLVGMLADYAFQQRVDTLRVFVRVACDLNLGIKPKHISTLGFRPESEPGNYGRARAGCDLGECSSRARFHSKEVDELALGWCSVLIHQDADGFIVLQGPQNATRGLAFRDDAIAGQLPVTLHERVHLRVIKRSHYDVHRLRHERVRKGAELPITQMRRRKQDTPADGFGIDVVL